MSGIPIIGKIFDEIKKSPILQAIVIASVIYFTAGAGSSSFTAQGASTAAGGGGIGATTAATATTTSTGAISAQAAGAAAAGTAASTTAAVAPSVAAAGAAGTAGAAVAPGWFAANPMKTMMLGQGILGAAASSDREETEKAALAQREKERKDRGLFGFDFEGKPAGVVSSNMAAQVPGASVGTPAAPIISGQRIAESSVAPQQVPIMRKDLPKLNQAGQLTTG